MGWSRYVTQRINLLSGGVRLQHLIVLHKSRGEASEVRPNQFLKMGPLQLSPGFLTPPIYKSLGLPSLEPLLLIPSQVLEANTLPCL